MNDTTEERTRPHDELIAEARALVSYQLVCGPGTAADTVTRLISALEAARADGERLDWLSGLSGFQVGTTDAGKVVVDFIGGVAWEHDLRAAIDQARGIKP